jgi:hypothetical protein
VFNINWEQLEKKQSPTTEAAASRAPEHLEGSCPHSVTMFTAWQS